MRKKIGICMAFLTLVLGLGACGDPKDTDNVAETSLEEEEKPQKKKTVDDFNDFLIENGNKVVDAILEKTKSDTYLRLLGTQSLQDSELYKNIRAMEYKEPDKIYRVQLTDEFLNLFFNSVLEADDLKAISELSEASQKEIRDRIAYTYLNLLNQRMGVEAVAMSSVLSGGRVVISEGYKGERGILIYVYPDAYPLAVSYCGGSEEGIISMSGNFIFEKDFISDTIEDLRASLSKVVTEDAWYVAGVGLKIEQIK